MAKREYIIVKDFAKHQHYKGSRPIIWIKLYMSLLRSDKFFNLIEDERWVYVGLLLLAALKKNQILFDLNFLKANLCHYNFPVESLERAIFSLKREGLIAIKLLSGCYQDDRADKEKDKDEDKDKEIDIDGEEQRYKLENFQIGEIMKLFKEKINPTLNFGNKTQRQAIVDLLVVYNNRLEDLKDLVEYAISVQGKKFYPVITTPYNLKEKLGDLMVHYKRDKVEEIKFVGI